MSYRSLGFSADPFSNKALQADEEGEKLVVDREAEVKKLVRRVQESDKVPTLEGPNGVGKTSIINIALHRLLMQSKRDDNEPMFIPCRRSFQINKEKGAEEFLDEFYLQVALTLVESADILRPPPGYTKAPIEVSIKNYIQSPIIRNYTGSILGNGLGFGGTPNSGKGWERVGFRAAIDGWLKLLFPKSETGGVVCVIDNLEILQSSAKAKETIEALRDTAFTVAGIKWILCGSSGVVRGVASSTRLAGWLHKPINIGELREEVGGEVYDKRVETFRKNEQATLPLTRDNFITLFDMFKGNSRFALDEAGAFCTWIFDEVDDLSEIPADSFERWLREELETNYDEIFVFFRDRDEEAFQGICQQEIFVPNDCSELGFDDVAEFTAILDRFQNYGLVTPTLDQNTPEDTVYEISPKSLKLQYFIDSQADRE
jgi:hypothetical protein